MIQIRIPNYLRQVQVSKTRRPKLYTLKSCPKLYQGNPQYEFRETKHYGNTIVALYDKKLKSFVIANINLLEKPRFVSVNGNDILRMHKDVLWRKIMPGLDAMFTSALLAQITKSEALAIQFPWKVSLTFRTHFGHADWDMDNPWIYEKCFSDALKRFMGLDDSILKITNNGEKKFRPVRSFETPELVLTIEHDHEYLTTFAGNDDKIVRLYEGREGKAGEIEYDYTAGKATIFTGRREPTFGKAKDAIRKLLFVALNDMVTVSVPRAMHTSYEAFFQEFKKYNIKIIITP